MSKNAKMVLIAILSLIALSLLIFAAILFYKQVSSQKEVATIAECEGEACESEEKDALGECTEDCGASDQGEGMEKVASSNKGAKFGFLDAYGQGMPSLYNIWKKDLNLDLIEQSSILAKDLSIGWTRMTFVYSKDKGVDDYAKKRVAQAKKDGVSVFMTIAVEEEDYQKKEYSDWLQDMVSEYSTDVKYWQIHNEVGKENRFEDSAKYIELVKKTSSVIKQNCKDCQVVMGSMMPFKEYYAEVIEQGDAYVDAYDFHIFAEEEMRRFADFSSRITKPLFVTEISTYAGKPEGVPGRDAPILQTEKKQSETLIKWYTKAFYHGADYVLWSQFVEWYQFQGKVDGLFDFTGLVYNGMCNNPSSNNICSDKSKDKGALQKKEAYYSLKTFISKVGSFDSVEKISDTQYKFSIDGKSVYVLWCESGSCQMPDEISGEIDLIDYQGKSVTKNSSQAYLTETPVFIEMK